MSSRPLLWLDRAGVFFCDGREFLPYALARLNPLAIDLLSTDLIFGLEALESLTLATY